MIRPGPPPPSGTRLLVRPLLSRTPLTAGPATPLAAASRRAVLVHRGRTALWHGLRALGLGRGDRVLFPTYCCGAELEVLLHAGLEPVFYPVDARAVPNHAAVASLLRQHRPRVLYLIHYFGLPVPLAEVRAMAREQGALVIEDCAHALYALDEDGSGVGSAADLAIFSLPKHLPAPNGGLMVLRGDDAWDRPAAPPHRAPGRVTAKSLAYVLAAELEHRLPGVHDWVRRLIGRPPPGESDRNSPDVGAAEVGDGNRFDPGTAGWDASVVTKLLVRRADGERIRGRRRCNYGMLAATLDERGPIRPLRPAPAAGASPYLLPVLPDEPDAFRRFMARNGVETLAVWRDRHPAVPGRGFPRERELRARLVGLPVHHGLRPHEIARIGALLELWRTRPEARCS
jgi:perosamine synthetase